MTPAESVEFQPLAEAASKVLRGGALDDALVHRRVDGEIAGPRSLPWLRMGAGGTSVDRERKDKAIVVVRVFADQVDAARCLPDAVGKPAELPLKAGGEVCRAGRCLCCQRIRCGAHACAPSDRAPEGGL